MNRTFDIVILNGTIVDGTGKDPYEADVAIAGDTIACISKKTGHGKRKSLSAGKSIDATGMLVTPGFIDTHAHSDFTLLADPAAEGKICQGITTEINGNCGLSAAPLSGEALKQREEDLRVLGIAQRWNTFAEYFALLEKKKPSLNVCTLVGHGNLRACVAGYADRKMTETEQMQMQHLLKESVQSGAKGLSTGLIYPPGVYSDTAELISLCRTLPRSALYTSHMRSEGDHLLESIDEIVRIGREAGRNVHISHIKTSGESNWPKIDEAISRLDNARRENIQITCDRYPYTAASTDLDAILPRWTYEGGTEKELARLRDSSSREKIRNHLLNEHPEGKNWGSIYVSEVHSIGNKWMEGKNIITIADRVKTDPVDAMLDLLIEEKLRVGAIFQSMSESNLRRFLLLPFTMIGTDSSARSAAGPTCRGKPHPRGFGSFPRFLGQYIRDLALVDIASAIQKITMLPAKTFRIHKRGVLRQGAFADIVLFDFKKIMDRATFDEPFLRPDGIGYVLVNGAPAIWKGEMTGLRTGRILRQGRQ